MTKARIARAWPAQRERKQTSLHRRSEPVVGSSRRWVMLYERRAPPLSAAFLNTQGAALQFNHFDHHFKRGLVTTSRRLEEDYLFEARTRRMISQQNSDG
jgi:hypothetical protein